MKYLVLVHYEEDLYFVGYANCNSLEEAKQKAVKSFDRHISDSGLDYRDGSSLPTVSLMEVGEEISVDVSEHYFKKRAEEVERHKKYEEEAQRRQYEFLHKKFGSK